jgi:hypothetical protein
MHGHREDKLVVFSVEEIELVHPQFFYVSRVDPTVAELSRSDQLPQLVVIDHKTDAYEFGAFLMNIIGGRSSRYHEAGISTSPVVTPPSSGCEYISLVEFDSKDTFALPSSNDLDASCSLADISVCRQQPFETLTHQSGSTCRPFVASNTGNRDARSYGRTPVHTLTSIQLPPCEMSRNVSGFS